MEIAFICGNRRLEHIALHWYVAAGYLGSQTLLLTPEEMGGLEQSPRMLDVKAVAAKSLQQSVSLLNGARCIVKSKLERYAYCQDVKGEHS